MGKKMKKKAPIPHKIQHRASMGSPKSVLDGSGCDEDGDKKTCNHYTKSTIELNRILVKIRSSSMDVAACEHCREEPVNRRSGKEKGKHPKKKGAGTKTSEVKSDENFMWVCLECGRSFCGGGVSMLEPYGHARRHSKQDHHHWAVRADDPIISWCYSCFSSVPIEMPEDSTKEDSLAAMNDRSWSLKNVALKPLESKKLKGNKVRGLLNLGNTCFFNSVMQNLFAMNILRNTLSSLDMPVGPLSSSLRMLFVETSRGADLKGVLSPKSLFGCICAKAPQFRGYQQQDSHELLRCLLDELHLEETNARKSSDLEDDEDKINTKTKATMVDALFSGQLSSTVSCLECQHTSAVNEPFLDLSLPVPSKKHTPKKVPPLSPKKINKKDKQKSKHFRECCSSQVSVNPISESNEQPSESNEQPSESNEQPSESNEQPSESSDSGIVMSLPANDNLSEAQDFTWMNFLGDQSPNSKEFDAVETETSAMQCSYNKLADETVSNEHSVSGSPNETESRLKSANELHCYSYSNDFTVSSASFIKKSCKDEVPQSNLPVNIILLPYKEHEQDLEDINCMDASVSESCAPNSSCKQTEEDFDGIGDLFSEPEATSHLNAETSGVEEMDIAQWGGSISESNLEEVDDTNAPVSINSCLALFTKPELLFDEQAWYCERCSEILQEKREIGKNKQSAEGFDLSLTMRSVLDEDELKCNKIASNSHGYCSKTEVIDNGMLASSPQDAFVIQIEGSQSSGEICNNATLDQDMSESETSQCSFALPIRVNSHAQESYFNDQSSVENDGKKPKVSSHSFQSHISDRSQIEVSRVRKKGLKSGKVHPAKDNNGEGFSMVKRDAIKRILIDRVPNILTIHLKRFSQDARGRLTKLSGHVSFQETLDLRPYLDPRCIVDRSSYHLIGVVEHSGSMSRGHYVAYVRGNERGTARTSTDSTEQSWFYASDAYVREVSLTEVLQSEAYILFYERI